ncbi:MAG: PEGA domain-containing protein [Methanolinea sp.]|nr:PEGA domain-containing protein [Methanolinea sp.]
MHARVAVLLTVSALVLVAIGTASSLQENDGPRRLLRIESVPAGAAVMIDNLLIGLTPVTYPFSPSDTEIHSIVISASGYRVFRTTYSPETTQGTSASITATLEPTLSWGTLVVRSQPSGALVTVDNARGQQAPWTYPEIRAGGHLVQAFLSGYKPYSAIVEVPDGGTAGIDATLWPLTDVGIIQAKSSPGGADVYIDGIFRGSTAVTIGNIDPGTHYVLLKSVGFQDWSDLVTLRPREMAIIDVPLARAQYPSAGFIHVGSDPTGASVFIDGIFYGKTQPGNPLDITGVPPGEHSVTLSLENYGEFSTTVNVRPGETTYVNATLSPLASRAATGTLQVMSSPSGANVFIDNTCQGITPLTIASLPAGPHTLMLTLAGYQPHSLSFDLAPGAVSHLEVALAPEPTSVGMTSWPVIVCLVAMSLVAGRRIIA